jgi:hypothetical protein
MLVLGSCVVPVALAFWTGSSSGSVATVLPNPLALSLDTGTPTTALYPGGSSDVAVILHNPSTSIAHVASIALDTSASTPFTFDSGHTACAASALSLTAQTNGGAGWDVPAKAGATAGALTVDLASAITMSGAAVNACQGATITVRLVATA